MATHAQRQHIAHLIDYLYAKRSQLDYPPHDIRGALDAQAWTLTEQQSEHVLNAGGRRQDDCSQLDAWILRCAGVYKASEPGYTGSHLDVFKVHYRNLRVALVGAVVVFGVDTEPTGHHEAIVRTPDPEHGNPVLASHGQPGYRMITFEDELAAQESEGYRGYTVLSIAHL